MTDPPLVEPETFYSSRHKPPPQGKFIGWNGLRVFVYQRRGDEYSRRVTIQSRGPSTLRKWTRCVEPILWRPFE